MVIIGSFNIKTILIAICLNFVALGIRADSESPRSNAGGPIIDSVVIENGDIFDLSLPDNDIWLFRLANKLHIKTKKEVIERELLLRRGDVYSQILSDESERNLRSLPFLWDAEIELVATEDGVNIMKVTTSDRWTLAGGPTFSRNSGQVTYQFGFEELNLFGYGQRVAFDYFIREFEENYIRASFYERRLLSSRLALNAYYNDDPEVGMKSISLTRPLFSLDSKFGYGIEYTEVDRDDKYYLSGHEVARNRFKGRLLGISTVYRFGTYKSKASVGLSYVYKDIGISDRMILPGTIVTFPSDSLNYSLTMSMSTGTVDFLKTRKINGIRRIEDFAVGFNAGIAAGWAFDAGNSRNLYRTVSLSCNYTTYTGSSLIIVDLSRAFWYKEEVDYRKTTVASIRYFNNAINWLTPVIAILYADDWRLDGREALYLGENNGLRAFPRYYDEGERLLRLNFENRFFTGLNILSNSIGLVQFVDIGQVWTDGEKFNLERNLWTVGAGIRIGTERFSNAELIRIDLAYAGNIENWQLSFGVGQYIQ